MSFHYQRVANKLSKTKFPTSVYQSHYSFKAKRSIKEEVYMPKVKPEEIVNDVIQPQSPVNYSNWRRAADLPYYEYPEHGAFWASIVVGYVGLVLFYSKQLNSKNHKVLDAYTNTSLGIIDTQYLLDIIPINPKPNNT